MWQKQCSSLIFLFQILRLSYISASPILISPAQLLRPRVHICMHLFTPIDDFVNGGRSRTDSGFKLIVGRSAIFKMADRSTTNLYAGGGLIRHLRNRLFPSCSFSPLSPPPLSLSPPPPPPLFLSHTHSLTLTTSSLSPSVCSVNIPICMFSISPINRSFNTAMLKHFSVF